MSTAAAPSLIEQARSLQPLLDRHGAGNDASGEIAAEVVEALHASGLFGIWVPRELGGSELDPVTSLQVISELSYADPSTAWVTMAVGLATGTGGAFLGDDAVARLFAGERFPVIAGQGTRPGTAVRDGNGLRLTGSWSFASGIKHADHIHTLGIVEGTGEALIFVLPVEQATLIDNWDVMGLRGTGSIDYEIHDVFVDPSFTHAAMVETSPRGGGLYSLGIINFAAIGHSAWAIGVGRRLLDELRDHARARAGRAGQIAESDGFHADFARAEAKLRAARALVLETWADVWDTIGRGDPLSVRQHTLVRLAMNHVTWTLEDVSRFVYASSGTSGLRAGTVQRLVRDVHAGTQHVTSGPGALRAAGRELAGLADGQRWLFLDLVDG